MIAADHDKAIENHEELMEQIRLIGLAVTLRALPQTVNYLGQFAPRPWRERNGKYTLSEHHLWRSVGTRMAGKIPAKEDEAAEREAAATEKKGKPSEKLPEQPVRLWGSPELTRSAEKESRNKTSPVEFKSFAEHRTGETQPSILLALGSSGSGRGVLAERIAQAESFSHAGPSRLEFAPRRNRLLINAGFSYDSDSMLKAIAEFLYARSSKGMAADAAKPGADHPDFVREEEFARGTLFDPPAHCLIILNGIDRFFGITGDPLSAELDHLFRAVVAHDKRLKPNVSRLQWLIIGTSRVRSYFATLGIDAIPLEPSDLHLDFASQKLVELNRASTRSAYLDSVQIAFATPLPASPATDHAKRVEDGAKTEYHIAAWKALMHDAHRPIINESAQAKTGFALEVDQDLVRRAFYAGHLSPLSLTALGVDCPEAFEILRTMAFIGTPIEAAVLLHAPKVRAIFAERMGSAATGDGDRARIAGEAVSRPLDELYKVLRKLHRLRLIIEIAPTTADSWNADEPEPEDLSEEERTNFPWRRFGLHRSLATELRERHGAPITEAKLTTSFNMSLFAAQPEERYTPEQRFHEELGELVDRLIGTWQELDVPAETRAMIDRADLTDDADPARHQLLVNRTSDDLREAFARMVCRESAICLRAALSIVRGYYSTGNLLVLNRHDLSGSESEEGALSAHASRLDRILRNFGNIATARSLLRQAMDKKYVADLLKNSPGLPVGQAEAAEAKARTLRERQRDLGSEPFYADDLVWLHNERAVAKLLQGDLYSARRSFSLAERANGSVEDTYHGHNWRRISLNLVALLIERGRLPRAERRLDEIEATIERGVSAVGSGGGRLHRIRSIYGNPADGLVTIASAEFAREEVLAAGLTTGYRGLIAQMRGEYEEALDHFRCATTILRRIGEMRAYALFQRHYAAMGSAGLPRAARLQLIELAITAADSVQQMDLSHRARIVRAILRTRDAAATIDDGHAALQDLKNALEYAVLTDCYRVRIEAGAALAGQMRKSGDYEAALRNASDAMAIATRYGHALQKIWLRVEIGQILMLRGDPKSGDALLRAAERAAIRTGYQRTIEHVHRARVQIMTHGGLSDVPDLFAHHVP